MLRLLPPRPFPVPRRRDIAGRVPKGGERLDQHELAGESSGLVGALDQDGAAKDVGGLEGHVHRQADRTGRLRRDRRSPAGDKACGGSVGPAIPQARQGQPAPV
jgi:hypothetical protein